MGDDWLIELDDTARTAHERWVRGGFRGEGRLVREDVDLSDAPMGGRTWDSARFVRCDMRRLRASLARFRGTELVACDLSESTLGGATLDGALLVDCNLSGAAGSGVYFVEAELERCQLDGVWMERSRWTDARITGASLRGADLSVSTLSGVRFVDCDLRGAKLGWDPEWANLAIADGARFERCDLRGADVAGLRLSNTIFDGCAFHGLTGLPRIEGPIDIRAADLSEAFDGSVIGSTADVMAMWTP